jgi:spermidine synthase
MRITAGDARRYLRQENRQYDFIFGDAFHGLHSIPAHLVTVQFFQEIKRHLTDRGVYMMNIISAVEGDRSALFHAVANTVRQVFDKVETFTLNPGSPADLQILLLVASRKELPVESAIAGSGLTRTVKSEFLNSYLRHDRYSVSKRTVLTDEFNPVEHIVASARND